MTKQVKKPQKKLANGRYEGTNYRYSDRFIQVATNWLIAWIFIGLALGFGLGAFGDVIFESSEVPDWYNIMAISFAISGIALPLTVGAWLGAMSINKYAGPIGLLLVFGMGAYAVGKTVEGQGMWVWIGAAAVVLSVALFFIIGFKAKVAMWLQLPIFHSPRLYISKGGTEKKKPTAKKK